ncbi:MAG: PAS domain-containing protein [Colwellia sp.]|nr:PAS domain-containing protein [Colwellia sp.]
MSDSIFSDAIYKALFDYNVDALSIIDPQTGKFIACNDSAVKLHDTGTKEKFIGIKPEMLSPKYQPNGELSSKLAMEHIQRALETGCEKFEWIHCKSDGKPFPAQVTLCIVVDKGIKHVLAIGRDITELKQAENDKDKLISELQSALDEIKILQGVIPICSYCHEIRDDKGAWEQMESYITKNSEAIFSHGICPTCCAKVRLDAGLDEQPKT